MYVGEESGGDCETSNVIIDTQIIVKNKASTVPPMRHLRLARRLQIDI